MIRLALLDDHEAVLTGLRRFLDSDRGLEVLAAAPDPASLASRLNGRRPDVLVLDYDPSCGDALALCWRLKCRSGAPRVLLYTAYATPALMIAARAAQVDGVVDKSVSARALSGAIRAVVAGERRLPAVARTDFEAVVERLDDEDLATFALLLDDMDASDVVESLQTPEGDAERRVLRVLDRIRPRLQHEPFPF
jgi:two-component system capsular synthesis response regulator RcsB